MFKILSKKSFVYSEFYYRLAMCFLACVVILLSINAKAVTVQAATKKDTGHMRYKEHGYINKVASEQEKKWGIRVVGVRATMNGMMIDFRYQVTDPKKAAPLLDLNKQALLTVEKSGAKLGVPHAVKVGSLRQTTQAKKVAAGKEYFVLFGNPGGKLAKPGDKLAVSIGEFNLKHMILQ
jgi:hypothetical protein